MPFQICSMSCLKGTVYVLSFDKPWVYLRVYCDCLTPTSPFTLAYELPFDPCCDKTQLKPPINKIKMIRKLKHINYQYHRVI